MEIKIFSDIVGEKERLFLEAIGSSGVSFKTIDDAISAIPAEDTRIDLKINCRGGNLEEAWAIYDSLRSSGKEIHAEVIGQASSSATIILCSAPIEHRVSTPNATFLLHNPYIEGFNAPMRSNDLRNIADSLKMEEHKMLRMYVERTTADASVLQAIIAQDSPISAERAKEIGLISTILAPVSAKNNTIISMEKNKIKDAFLAFGRSLGIIKAMELQTADGNTLELEKESGEPQVGDVVTSEDGEYLMPDGTTIVVANGVIEDIKPAEDEQSTEEETPAPAEDELAKANQRIAELEGELKNVRKQAKTNEEREILNAVAVAGGKNWLMQARSNYKVQDKEMEQKEVTPHKMSLREYNESKKQNQK